MKSLLVPLEHHMKGSERHHDTNTIRFKKYVIFLGLLRNVISGFGTSNGQLYNARKKKLIANNGSETAKAEF